MMGNERSYNEVGSVIPAANGAASAAGASLDDPRVLQAMEEYLRLLQAGERPDKDTFLARYADVAEALAVCLQGLDFVQAAGGELSQSAAGPAPLEGLTSGDGIEPAVSLGDFRIVREVGRGGMGVVYEAEQISLGRRVALKVLPFAATMDTRHLQRFQNEAKAAACLHHTNIVPVHFVGCERGVHFYAMQFIDGQPLSDIIRQMREREKKATTAGEEHTIAYQPVPRDAASTPPVAEITPQTGESRRGRDYYRKVAEWGIQAAEALDHAHQFGIVHRDIKPGNLMLDGRGNLWVTDFGLAHMQHGEASLTATGQALGTPRYMSPEQALAKRVPIDHRTDVYSLGATLYELLTLRPAFASEDRQELLRQIAFEEPDRPRRLERAIPTELEIIVLKAMEKRPQDRYGTAQELADDLERWLKHEPIRARRPTLLQRASKWIRRHKPAAAASVVVLLMTLILASYVVWTHHDRGIRREASQKAILTALADSQQWQEQRRLSEALSAARSANGLLNGADVEEALRLQVRSRVADLELLGKLENIRLEKLTALRDWRFDREAADAVYEQTFREAGLDVEALPIEEVVERIRGSSVAVELAAEIHYWAEIRGVMRNDDDSSWKILNRVANEVDPDPVRTRVRKEMEKLDRKALLTIASSEDAFRLPLATLAVLGQCLPRDKEARGQVEVFLREAQKRHPNDFWLNHNLFVFFVSMQPPRLEEAIRFATVAEALRPDCPGVHHNLGTALRDKDHLDEAIAEFREAIHLKKDYAYAHYELGCCLYQKAHLDEAMAEFVEAIRLKNDYAEAHVGLGVLYAKDRLDDAIAECKAAIRIKKDCAEAHYNLGLIWASKGQLNDAIAEYKEAIRIKKDYADAHVNLGNVLLAKDQLDDAIDEYKEAIRIRKDGAEAHYNLGNSLRGKGRLDEAIDEYKEAIRIKKDFAEAYNNLGTALGEKGLWDEAIAEWRRAIRIKIDHVRAHDNLGRALLDKGQLDEAITEFRQAIRIKNDFAEAYCNLGDVLERMGKFSEALFYRRRGHELGSRNPRWPYPSAQWVQKCERLLQLDGKLPAILSGQKQPADTAERIAFAQFCQLPCKQQHLAAKRLYSEAFADKPPLADDLNTQHRYNAACAAALAGCGQGKDVDKLGTKERTRLRQQALDWLLADLKAYRQLMAKSAGKAGPMIAQRMQHWLKDDDFTGVRSETALAKLPEDERRAWQKLWADVTEMLVQAQGKTATEKKSDRK
jgi:tetratricopeptide (TPR) repeat protein